MISIEGIGGTGKAVVNLLSFQRTVAGEVGIAIPGMQLHVTDQDPNGAWPGIDVDLPAQREGIFAALLGLATPPARAAAQSLYSSAELQLNVSGGFHGRPKVAASLMQNYPFRDYSSDTVVLVFSDIGGTGAGLGPQTLRALCSATAKTCIVAIVFGKYLTSGAARPIGFEWLRRHARLVAPEHRLLDCYYIRVPPLAVAGTPPVSGLNTTPALLMASSFVWRFAQAVHEGRREQFLQTNDRADARERIEIVDVEKDRRFGIDGEGDFSACLIRAAESNSLNVLLPRGQEYRNVAIRRILQESAIAREAWAVLSASMPGGTAVSTAVDYHNGFATTYTSVPEIWAAVDWFHTGVANDPTGPLAAHFRKLVHAYVLGRLHVVATGWCPFGGDEIYALATEPVELDAPDFVSEFDSRVVGFFAASRPFWTTERFAANLEGVLLQRRPVELDLRVTDDSPLGRFLIGSGRDELLVDQVQASPCIIHIRHVTRQHLSEWSWAITTAAADWADVAQIIENWPLLGESLEVMSGRLPLGAEDYALEIRGVGFVRKPLGSRDGIQVLENRGVQYYELNVGEDGSERVVKRILNTSVIAPNAIFITDPAAVGILCGNIEMLVRKQEGN